MKKILLAMVMATSAMVAAQQGTQPQNQQGCVATEINYTTTLYNCIDGKTYIKIKESGQVANGLYLILPDGKKAKLAD
jgi:hypothetical protein